MQTQALVAFRERTVTRMPFELFLAELDRLHGRGTVAMNGAVRFGGFPHHEAVADGLYLVLLRMAQRVGIELNGEEDVRRTAAFADRLVQVGMASRFAVPADAYRSVEEAVPGIAARAARAFQARVIVPVERALSEAHSCGPARNLWAMKSGIFFGELVAVAHGLAIELEGNASRFEMDNLVIDEVYDTDGDLGHFHLRHMAYGGPTLPSLRFDGLTETMRRPEHLRREDAFGPQTILSALHARRQWDRIMDFLAFVRRLPVRTGDLSESIVRDAGGMHVETQWLNTQILLAAADEPDAEQIPARKLAHILDVASRADPRDVSERLARRFAARDATFSQRDVVRLSSLVRERLPALIGMPVAIGAQCGQILISAQMQDLDLDASGAEAVLMGDILTAAPSVSGRKNRVRAARTLLGKIDWSRQMADDLFRFFDEFGLVPELVVGLKGATDAARKEFLGKFFQIPKISQADVRTLLKGGAMTVAECAAHGAIGLIPPAQLRTLLLSQLAEGETNLTEAELCGLTDVFARLSLKDIRQLIDDPRTRALVEPVLAKLVYDDENVLGDEAAMIAIAAKIGPKRIGQVLSGLAWSLREGEATDPMATEVLANWQDHAAAFYEDLSVYPAFRLAQREAVRLARSIGERDAFDWRHAHLPKKERNKLWHAYESALKAHARRAGDIERPVRNKRSVTAD